MHARHQTHARQPLRGAALHWAALLALVLAFALPAPAGATMFTSPDSATVVQGGTTAPIMITILGANNPGQVPVNMLVNGMPAGVTTIPSPVVSTFVSPDAGGGSFRFDVAPGTTPGVYNIQISGPGGFGIGASFFTLTIPAPSVNVAPPSASVQAGQTTPPYNITVTNATDQTLSFVPTLPPALVGNTVVQPSPATVVIPNGPTSGGGSFALATSPGTPTGTHQVAFVNPVTGLGFAVLLQVTAAPPPPPPPPPPPAPVLSAAPTQVTLGPAELGPPVMLTLANAAAGSYPLTVQLPAALVGNTTVEPAVPTITVPAAGVSSSTVARLRTTAASPPGTYTIGVENTGLGVATSFTLRIQSAEGSVSLEPGSVSLGPGQTSGLVTLRVGPNNLGGQTLDFRAQPAAGVSIQPSTVRVQIPPGGGPASATFRVVAASGASPGSRRLALGESTFGLGAEMTVVVEEARAAVSVLPARVVVAPGAQSDQVTLRVADSNLAGQALSFRLGNPGAAPGLSLAPAQIGLTVPAGGGAVSRALRVVASAAATPGIYSLEIVEGRLSQLRTVLTVEVEQPVVLERLEPRALAQGVVEARLRLIGDGFQPGARVESSSPLLAITGARVLSPTRAEARVSVRRDAPVGAYPVDLINPDGTRSRTSALLAVIDRGALTAPVGVETLAIIHPAPGAAVALDDAIYPRGLIGTTGTGTLVGSWLLDGVPFDRFVVQARGGEPAAVTARLPIPRSSLGRHRLELAIESPVDLVSEAVELLQVVARASRLKLLAPAEGAVGRGLDLLFRWSEVPGASGYQVEILRERGAPLVYRVPYAHWTPRHRDVEAIGSGLRRWRVRPILAAGVQGEATEARTFALLPERVELTLRSPRRGSQGSGLTLRWDDAGPGILYRVEIWGEPADAVLPEDAVPLFVALTPENSYELPAGASWGEAARSWRIVAVGPAGLVLGTSKRVDLPPDAVALASRLGRGVSGHGAPGGGGAVRIALAAQSSPPEERAGPVDLVPAAGAEVDTPYPTIEASWEPAVAPDEVSLVVDGTDVTLVAEVAATSVRYESMLPLAPGEHRVELWLGETQTGWTFNVAESAAADSAAIPEPTAAEQQAAWLGDPAIEGGTDAGVTYDLGQEGGASAGSSGGWTDWQVGAEGTVTQLSADDLEEDEATGQALLSGQVDYRSGSDESGGSFSKGTGDVGYTESFDGPSPDQKSRSWVLGGGLRQQRTRQEVALGYSSPDFLFGSELLSDGLPQGGGQATAALGPASLSYYRTFDPDFGGALSGAFGPSLDLQAGALTLGDESGRFELRAVGLETEEDASDFDPGGEGSVFGLFGRMTLTSSISLVFEGARGDFTPAPGSFDDERSGNAFRLGLDGSRGSLTWGVALRYSEAGFVNPAARGLTAGTLADRAGFDASVTHSFESGASLGLELRHLQGGTDSGLDSSDARQDGGIVRYSGRLGEKVYLNLSGNYMATQGGGAPEFGIPETDQTDMGAQLSLTETWGGVSFSQSLTWQDTDDANDPSRANEVLNASLSANATFSPRFSLFGQLDGMRNTTGGFFGGETETLLASVQPSWTLTELGISIQPYAAYNRFENDFSDGATESESYRLMVSWAPPKLSSFFGLQASADWNRSKMPGLPDDGFTARYTASITLRWNGSGSAGGAPAAPEYALLPEAARRSQTIRQRLAGLPGGARLASWL